MTIGEAIETIDSIVQTWHKGMEPKAINALRLGIEALKQIKRERQAGVGFWDDLLPGESFWDDLLPGETKK